MARHAKRRLLVGSAAAALVVATLASGCGGSAKAEPPAGSGVAPVLQGDPTQVLAAAAGRTVTGTNASIALTVPVLAEGKFAGIDGEGAVDFATDRLKLVVPNAEQAEERQFNRTLYVLLPAQAGPALAGKKWVRLDLDTAQPTSPDPFNLSAFDPRQLLTTVTAVRDARMLGREPVRDVTTEHFAASIDPAKLASAGLPARFAAQFSAATKGAPTPVNVWLDDAGLIRRMTISLPPPNAGATAAGVPLTTIELFGFGGADVSFTEPPPAEVADAAQLAGLSGNGD
jgi:hypothetical protein